jgi:hypothetical protein
MRILPTSECGIVDPKWKKGCPKSVVLFATDGRGTATVITHQGPDAAYIYSDNLTAKMLMESDLATHPFPGIWVWEGEVHGHRDYWGEYDEEYVGEVRPLTDDEARALREDDLLWDASRWVE